MGVPTVLVARTDAHSATLITSDVDAARPASAHRRAHDRGLLLHAQRRGGRHRCGRWPTRPMPTCSGGKPLTRTWTRRSSSPRRSTGSTRASCWPTTARPPSTGSASWTTQASPSFQRELGAMGYKFQFVTLAGFHTLNHSMFRLALDYKERGMAAYSMLQQDEFASEADGYTATKHQREVGTGYFDDVAQVDLRWHVFDTGPRRLDRRGAVRRGVAKVGYSDGPVQRLFIPAGGRDPRPGSQPRFDEILTPEALAFRRDTGPRIRARSRTIARQARRAPGRARRREAARLPCPRPRTSARASGRSRRSPPTCRTGAWRSPARPIARW